MISFKRNKLSIILTSFRFFYNNIFKQIIFSLFTILVVLIYPISFIYFRNLDHATFHEFLQIFGQFVVLACFFSVISFSIERETKKATLLTVIFLLFSFYFRFFEKALIIIFPMFYYWHVLMIVLTIIVIMAFVIKKKFNCDIAHKINKIILIIFSFLIIYNFGLSIPKIIQTIKNSSKEKLPLLIENKSTFDSNIYYLIFDEFGGYDNVERYCNYDNSLFYNSLQSLGFNVSKHSRNLTIYTDVEIPNLLNLELINTVDMSHNLRVQSLKSPFLFSLVKEKDYQLNVVIDKIFQNHIPIEIINKDYEYKSGPSYFYEETVNFLILKNTIIYPLINKTFYKRNDEITNMFNYVINSPNLQSKQLFTFGYFTFPHSPWVVDEFGKNVDPRNYENWRNSKYYCDQMKYASKKIIEITKKIIKVDPNSIIIIQSDHGFRQPTHLNMLYGEKNNLQEENIYETNILNAVYFKGEEMQIESLSGLDTLIKVFNKLFYLDFPYVGLDH